MEKETIKFSKLKKLCFCNSNELQNKIYLIGGIPHDWQGIGMVECDLDPKKQTIEVVE